MKAFFLNSMLVADLAAGTLQRQPLPQKAFEAGDLSVLAELFPGDVVIAAGRLSGSYAPSSSVLTLYAGGKGAIVKGHSAPALRRCGLDAVVIKGHAASPCGLVLDEKAAALVPADPSSEVPAQRAALERGAKLLRGTYADTQAVCIVTGPAAFLGSSAAALAVEPGLAPRSAELALALAARRVAGICFNGARPFLSPVPLDDPARTSAKVERLTASSLAALIKAAKPDFAGKAPAAVGRSVACFGCTAPCGFWMPVKGGHAASTGIMGLAALCEAGAPDGRIAEVLALACRFGLDPEGLAALAKGDLPDSLVACVQAASAVPEMDMGLDIVRKGAFFGVCPFYLKRFPEALDHLEKYQAQA